MGTGAICAPGVSPLGLGPAWEWLRPIFFSNISTLSIVETKACRGEGDEQTRAPSARGNRERREQAAALDAIRAVDAGTAVGWAIEQMCRAFPDKPRAEIEALARERREQTEHYHNNLYQVVLDRPRGGLIGGWCSRSRSAGCRRVRRSIGWPALK
jgi:hypothetical protein